MGRHKVSWEEFGDCAHALMHQIDSVNIYREPLYAKGRLSGVYTPSKNGTVLCAIASQYFKIPILSLPADNCLLIDDVLYTGNTIQAIKQHCTPLVTAVYVWYKRNMEVLPDCWILDGSQIDNDSLTFPWMPKDGWAVEK